MNGFIIVDKPQGITSFDVVRRIRRLCRTRRVGHAGTLDPLATGVLPVAVGDATRLIQFLMEGDKTYRATLRLGVTTDTQDAEGEVVSEDSWSGVTGEAVLAACRPLIGKIRQIPPMYSALKKDGVPLHRLARQGVEVERKAREIEITRLEVLDIDLPDVTFEVDCSKGAYVRTLCHDIGQALGCGAHLTALRRTRNGAFGEADSIPLAKLEAGQDAVDSSPPLLSLADALPGLPPLEVSPAAASRLRDGVPPAVDAVTGALPAEEGANVLLLDRGVLLAVARYAPLRLREKRGDFELLRVFNRQEACD